MNFETKEDSQQGQVKILEIEELDRKIAVIKGILSNLLDRVYVLECQAGFKKPDGSQLFHNRDCLEEID